MSRAGAVGILLVMGILGGMCYLRYTGSDRFHVHPLSTSPPDNVWESGRHDPRTVRQHPTVLRAAPDDGQAIFDSPMPKRDGHVGESGAFPGVFTSAESSPTHLLAPAPSGTAPSGAAPSREADAPEGASQPAVGTQASGVAAKPVGSVTEMTPLRGKLVLAPGASFWTLAEKAYGTGSLFRALYAYNRERVPSPDRIHGGEVIEIPELGVLQQRFPELCPRLTVETARGTPASTTQTR